VKLNRLDLNKLYIFCTVIEQKGYAGTSSLIGLTRSAISQSIHTLEVQLGKPLFHRSGTKMFPTEDAMRLYDRAMKYQLGLESALEEILGKQGGGQGLLRIGAYFEFTKSKLIPAIESFYSQNPRAQIQFLFDAPSRLEKLLETDRIDMAISIYPHKSKKFESRKLSQEELCLVGRKDLVSAAPSAAELLDIPVIDYYPTHLAFKRWWSLHYKNKPAQFSIRTYAATAEMVLHLVERRLGIGVVPKYLLKGSSSELQIISPTQRKLLDYLWINTPKNKNSGMLMESLMSHLQRILN